MLEVQAYNLRVGTHWEVQMEILAHTGKLRDGRETYSKYLIDRAIRGSAAVFVYASSDFDDCILP
jgi:hypothetical protein